MTEQDYSSTAIKEDRGPYEASEPHRQIEYAELVLHLNREHECVGVARNAGFNLSPRLDDIQWVCDALKRVGEDGWELKTTTSLGADRETDQILMVFSRPVPADR